MTCADVAITDTTYALLKKCWPVEVGWASNLLYTPPTDLPVGTTSVETPQYIPLADFIQVLLMRSHTSLATLQLALHYTVKAWAVSIGRDDIVNEVIEKGMNFNADGLPSSALCSRRTFLVCLILANKYLHDKSYSNRAWASITNMPAHQISLIERDMLSLLDFDLYYSKESMHGWQRLFDMSTSKKEAHKSILPESPLPSPLSDIAPTKRLRHSKGDISDLLHVPNRTTAQRKEWVQHLSPPITPDTRSMTSPPAPKLPTSQATYSRHVPIGSYTQYTHPTETDDSVCRPPIYLSHSTTANCYDVLNNTCAVQHATAIYK